ncbi:2-amino-4-hydroxy-6-hydroxymethyldihydropteridine diphosphokinase [Xylella taiwanensis]|nr:2-amino-4-hydroxy-6-hydroxymethyldihydropteridine diphosphokinase [Xylella taiwanensis]
MMMGNVVAYVGLGANLGPVEMTLRAAIAAFDELPLTRLRTVSRLYRTPPWGREDQAEFVNAVAALDTRLAPLALLDALLALEHLHGRVRLPGDRWGPRTLDLDLLLYGEQVLELPRLSVPHPHLHERAFVVVPLAEIAAELVLPHHGMVCDLRENMDTCGLVPIR